jgi:hypothetical protein
VLPAVSVIVHVVFALVSTKTTIFEPGVSAETKVAELTVLTPLASWPVTDWTLVTIGPYPLSGSVSQPRVR